MNSTGQIDIPKTLINLKEKYQPLQKIYSYDLEKYIFQKKNEKILKISPKYCYICGCDSNRCCGEESKNIIKCHCGVNFKNSILKA